MVLRCLSFNRTREIRIRNGTHVDFPRNPLTIDTSRLFASKSTPKDVLGRFSRGLAVADHPCSIMAPETSISSSLSLIPLKTDPDEADLAIAHRSPNPLLAESSYLAEAFLLHRRCPPLLYLREAALNGPLPLSV